MNEADKEKPDTQLEALKDIRRGILRIGMAISGALWLVHANRKGPKGPDIGSD